jgi:hypothetical protein
MIDDLIEPVAGTDRFAPSRAAPLASCSPLNMHAGRELCFAASAKPGVDICRLFKRFRPQSCNTIPQKQLQSSATSRPYTYFAGDQKMIAA